MAIELDFNPSAPNNLKFLRSIDAFRSLSGSEIESIAPLFKRMLFEANEILFEQGTRGTDIFIMEEGTCVLEYEERPIKHIHRATVFGELAMLGDIPRIGSTRAVTKVVILCFDATRLEKEEQIAAGTIVKIYKELARRITRYVRDEDAFYNDLDVLLIQDGGCAPGYNSVTGYITRFLEYSGRRVFVAKEGFRSLVSGKTEDFQYLVNDRHLYERLEHIPGVVFAPPLREARGAAFRSERYKEFINEELQKKAAQHIIERKVKVLVGIGGDGTLKGIKALKRFLPDSIKMFFIPVTIDSDIFGTECIGEHTGVQIGAEKIRSYMADSRSHHRLYIIEMMGAEGGNHALRSCLGAGADLAVLPNFDYDLEKIAAALKRKQNAVIVVAEGYKRNERKENGFDGNAGDYFLKDLLDAGLNVEMRAIAEGFSRDIRGAAPNYNDVMLSQLMARRLSELVSDGKSDLMPAFLGGREYEIPFSDIRTDNTVSERMAQLANRLIN